MRPETFKAGDIMMKRGEYAHGAFYVTSGEVELVEIGRTVGAGTLLGEIGLFTPDGLRIATARCKTDVQAARIDYDQFKQLYFQNPEFGFRLLHLIVGALAGEQRAGTAVARSPHGAQRNAAIPIAHSASKPRVTRLWLGRDDSAHIDTLPHRPTLALFRGAPAGAG